MTDKNHKHDDLRLRDAETDALDRELDVALAKYSAAEPRSGLEERILSNLRTERTKVPEQTWWRWSVAAAVAAVLVAAVSLTLRSARPSPPQVVQQVPTQQSPKQSSPQIASKDEVGSVRSATRPTWGSAHHSQAATMAVTAANPKLDVFPSPQPLSEQEQLLLSYARRDPDRAALLAEARMESLRQDAEERRQLASEDQDSRE